MSIEITRLLDQQLTSVMVSTNSIRLTFVRYPILPSGRQADSAILEIGIGYEVEVGGLRATYRIRDSISSFREGAHGILGLIEQTVASVEKSATGDLEISFGQAGKLCVLTDPDGYESYQIHWQSGGLTEA